MADNIVSQLYPCPWPVVVTDPAAPVVGAPVRFGAMTGIALNPEGGGGLGATETMVDFGIYIADHPVTDSVGGGIAIGDSVYYVDAGDRLENLTSGTPYGIALEAVGAGLTATIRVAHFPGPQIGAGLVNTAAIAAGALSADVAGRAKMAAGYFAAATVTDKFAVNTITGREIATSVFEVDLVDGGAAGDLALAAIAAGDELVFVGHFSTKAAIATLADLTSEFTAGAGVINNAGGTDTTNDQLMVIWIDKT